MQHFSRTSALAPGPQHSEQPTHTQCSTTALRTGPCQAQQPNWSNQTDINFSMIKSKTCIVQQGLGGCYSSAVGCCSYAQGLVWGLIQTFWGCCRLVGAAEVLWACNIALEAAAVKMGLLHCSWGIFQRQKSALNVGFSESFIKY